MGKEKSEEQEKMEHPSYHHFSHQHPLECTISLSPGNITCYGCNLRILSGKDYYSCRTCLFSLHQVCSKMPRKARHPAHPNHFLNLLVSPPDANSTFKCKACGDYVSGFYYNCSKCNISYHIICSALPLAVAISSHPHALKIEFLPPYDFCCDLCKKPSSKGWLYRCRFCEFDAHIRCAISDQRAQPAQLPDTLAKQLIDYGSESNELMQLIEQGVTRQDEEGNGREVVQNAVAGWDKKLHGPAEKLGLYQTKPYMPTPPISPTEGSYQDPSTPVSEDLTIPSYQFSDFCFSLELLKSPSSHDQANREASIRDKKVVPDMDESLGNSHQMQQQHKLPENWLNDAFLARGITHSTNKVGQNKENKIAKGHPSRSGVTEQRTISGAENSDPSCCWKLLSCCYYPKNQRCSKSFKNGGL